MPRMIFNRIALSAVQLLMLSLLVFMLSEFIPGDALTGQASPYMTGDRLSEMREQMGLDEPWPQRYAQWMGNVLRGDFGVSYSHKLPVTRLVKEKLLNTVLLGLVSFVLCFAIAIPLGAAAGRRPGAWPDKIISAGSYVFLSTPQAVFGVLAIFLFAYTLKWFPAGGSISADAAAASWPAQAASRLHHIVLPALTSAMVSVPVLVQLLRSEVETNQKAGYVSALRTRGISENSIFYRHVLRNSMLPVASLAGALIAALLSGAVLVESLFSYPGMGKLFVDSVLSRDYPVAVFLILIFAAFAILGTLLSDILLHSLDPRVKMR